MPERKPMVTDAEKAERDVLLRPLEPSDWASVREIYRSGIDSGDATFETTVPDWDDWDAAHLSTCRVVAVQDATILGFAALSPTSSRPVYRGVCEVMVYVAEGLRGQGVGSLLLATLITRAESVDVWTLQASIFPENVASIRAHERVGFREVGRRERIGRFHDGRWRDTVILERRSETVGVE